MNHETDPGLKTLFAAPPQLQEPTELMERIDASVRSYQRRRRATWFGAEAAVLVIAWFLSEPFAAIAGELMPWMLTTLIDTGDSTFGLLFAPVNSIAGVVAFITLLLGVIYRRLLRQ